MPNDYFDLPRGQASGFSTPGWSSLPQPMSLMTPMLPAQTGPYYTPVSAANGWGFGNVTPAARMPVTPVQAQPQGFFAGIADKAAQGPAATYQNTPVAQWTGKMFEDYKNANAPSQIPGYINMGLQGLNTIGQLGMGIWGLGQAREAFNFQKDMMEKNYANQLKSYNTAVEDRVRGKYSSQDAAARQSEINAEIQRKQLIGK